MLDAALKDYLNKSAEVLMTTSAALPKNSFASYSFSYVCGIRVSWEQFMKAQKVGAYVMKIFEALSSWKLKVLLFVLTMTRHHNKHYTNRRIPKCMWDNIDLV